MHPVTQTLIAIAAIAVVVCACLYADEHVTCFNFMGFTKGCVTH